jgi:hypothetical protein
MTDTVIEKREVPDWITHRVNRIGGMNRYGRPNFRVIWGGNRTHKVGGKFKSVIYVESGIIGQKKGVVTDVPEIRTLLKYHPFRWHLERWVPPEFYGLSEDWYRETWDEECGFHTQGDYPSEGDYEHVFYLAECPHMMSEDTKWCDICFISSGQYIPLEENYHILEHQIRSLLMSVGVDKKEEQKALFAREAEKRQIRNKKVTERVQEAMRPVMATQPTSWQDGTRCSVPEASMETLAALPQNKSSFSQSNSAMPNKKQRDLDSN